MKLNYRFAPLLLGLAALGAAGCGAGDLGLNKGGKLTGKVALDGKPLAGGYVIVASESGRYSVQGYINAEGVYTVPEPPLGKVTVAVQTAHLRGAAVPKGDPGKGKGGEGSRGMVLPDPNEIGLGFTEIPERYEKGETSGLTAEVKPGNQTHNLDLTGKP